MMLHPILLLASASLVLGHGRVTQPPSRASAWRLGFPTPANYDDDGLNCGGFSTQWSSNGGRCGICGDAYGIPAPRPHELGGTYGVGVIVAKYLPGATIATTTHLTASHMGYWEFKLCPDPTDNSQACFDRHLLATEDGETKYTPKRGSGIYELNYKLPAGLICEHCVLQWRYVAGNNWGICSNGTSGLGCGNQEEFRACSDIAIGGSKTLGSDLGSIPAPLLFYLQKGYFELDQAGHLIHQDPKRPTAPQRPKKPRPSNRQPKATNHEQPPNRQSPGSNQQSATSHRQTPISHHTQLSNRQPQTFNQYIPPHQQFQTSKQPLNRPVQSTNSQTHTLNYQTNQQPITKEQLQQFHLHTQTSSPPSSQPNRQPKKGLQHTQINTGSSKQPQQYNRQLTSNQQPQSHLSQPSHQQIHPSNPYPKTPNQQQTLHRRPSKHQSSKLQQSKKRKPKSKEQAKSHKHRPSSSKYEHKTSHKRKQKQAKSKKKKKAHGQRGKQKTRNQRYNYIQV